MRTIDLIAGIGEAIKNGLTAVWENISGTIWDIFFQWIYNAIYNAVADFFSMMGNLGMGIFGLAWVNAAIKLFSMFGWSLFIAGIIVCIYDLAIEQQTGRGNIQNTALNVIKGFFAVSLFTILPVELYKLCISLQNLLSRDLLSSFLISEASDFTLAKAAMAALKQLSELSGILNLIFIIALGYCVVKVFLANIKRGGILLTQIAVGSLYMFSIPRGYTDGFIGWCKQVIALCLTAFLQTTLLFLGLLTWQSDILMGLGIMMAANEVPRIAQHFGLDTSAKFNVMSVVHTTTSAVNLTRAIGKK